MTKSFRDSLDGQLKDDVFRAEWEALEPEYQIIKSMLDGRAMKSMTQKDLAEVTGITQADISKLENGNANPSLRTLERIAKGLGMRLKIEFIPA